MADNGEVEMIDEIDISKTAKDIHDEALVMDHTLLRDGRLTPDEAENEPEVRLLRLECAMGQMMQIVKQLNDVMPTICRKIKSGEVAIRGMEDMVRQIIKVSKRF